MTPEGQRLHDFLNKVLGQSDEMPEIGGSKLAEDFVSMMTEIREAIDEGKATVKAAVQELKAEIVTGSQTAATALRKEAAAVRQGFGVVVGNNPPDTSVKPATTPLTPPAVHIPKV